MENIIAVFQNRSHTMSFASHLKRLGARCRVVDTPRELSVSCGVSVVFSSKNLKQARFILSSTNLNTLIGVFEIYTNGPFKKYRPI